MYFYQVTLTSFYCNFYHFIFNDEYFTSKPQLKKEDNSLTVKYELFCKIYYIKFEFLSD